MGTLNQKDVITPYTFKEHGANFPVTEFLDVDPTQLAAKSFTNLFGQLLGTCTRKDFCGRLHWLKMYYKRFLRAAKIYINSHSGRGQPEINWLKETGYFTRVILAVV